MMSSDVIPSYLNFYYAKQVNINKKAIVNYGFLLLQFDLMLFDIRDLLIVFYFYSFKKQQDINGLL